jgi:hypothetical protein
MYVSTAASYSTAEYCQDVGSYTYTSPYPAVRVFNTALSGGMSALWLKGLGLNGSVPCVLSHLKTVTSVTLSTNALVGFLPPSLTTMTALSALSVQGNRLQGAIPTEYGACACDGSVMQARVPLRVLWSALNIPRIWLR